MKKFTILFFSIALVVFIGINNVSAQKITVTLVGTGVAGFDEDGNTGKNTKIHGPKDVCLDADGNLYFVEKGNGLIRKRSKDKGIITTIAGGGSSTADGIPATNAFVNPNYICIDGMGNIYFTSGNQVKKVSAATGFIYTVAGTGVAGYTGDGGAAASATLKNPQGICVDASNNLYVVDRGNHCIRAIHAASGFISTIAGNPTTVGYAGDGGPAISAELKAPVCITINSAGDIFFADQSPNYPGYDNSKIRKIDGATGNISTIAGATPGPATHSVPANEAKIGTTTGLCMGPSGNLFCNEMSCSCRELNFATDTLELVGGNFFIQGYSDDMSSPFANMNIPYGLCVDNAGNVYVADSGNQRIRKIIKLTHAPTFAFGNGQYFTPIAGVANPLDSLLWITDLDESETETWTVEEPPVNGTLDGFPATAACTGTVSTTKPTGLTYTPFATYTGVDSFKIKVSDGVFSDVVTIYTISIGDPTPVSVGSVPSIPHTNVFPNPASNVLNIVSENLHTNNAAVVITDIADRVFFQQDAKGNDNIMQVDISSLPAGVYLVRINGMEVKKFVKQ